jgi:site-specific DNA-methyltransferase (adenine-specific)
VKPYYQDDAVTIYHGDCREIIPHLPMVDALVTDPPYSSGGMVRGDRMQSTRDKYQSSGAIIEHPDFTGDNRDQRGFLAWASLWLAEVKEITAPGGVCCLFSDWRQLPTMTDAMQAGGWVWRGIVPWDKGNSRPMPRRFSQACEFLAWGSNGPRDFSTVDATYHPGILRGRPPADRQHSTQKPTEVMQTICEIVPRGGLILDAFFGSGTTGEACKAIGRRCIGIEKLEHNCEIAARRMLQEVLPL